MVTEYSGDIGNTVAVGELLLNDCFWKCDGRFWLGLSRLRDRLSAANRGRTAKPLRAAVGCRYRRNLDVEYL